MGKTGYLFLTLCLGAWVDSAGAQARRDLGAEFKQIFLQTSIETFERELVYNVLSDEQESITHLVNEDHEGRELARRIYAHADTELLEAEYRLNLRRSEHGRALAERLRRVLVQLAQFHFREDIKGVADSGIAFTNATFEARARLTLWTKEPAGWIFASEDRQHEMEFDLRVNAEGATICLRANACPSACTHFEIESSKMISYAIDPSGRRSPVATEVAGTPAGSEAKAHAGSSATGF